MTRVLGLDVPPLAFRLVYHFAAIHAAYGTCLPRRTGGLSAIEKSRAVFSLGPFVYNYGMESIIRNVRDIESGERRVLEQVLGQTLKENQQVIIRVVTLAMESPEKGESHEDLPPHRLPDWCSVYAGLSDDQVAEVEEVILQRADLTRPSE